MRAARKSRQGTDPTWRVREFAMMTFINTHSKGLTILPTHRLVRDLANFDFDEFRASVAPLFRLVLVSVSECRGARGELCGVSQGSRERTRHATACDWRLSGAGAKSGAFYLFVLRRDADLEALLPDISEAQRGLDVVLLHRLILEKGTGDHAEAVTAEKNRHLRARDGCGDRGRGSRRGAGGAAC